MLPDLLVCPICHADFQSNVEGKGGIIECSSCGRSYSVKANLYNMIPLSMPDNDLNSKWDTWQKLQENGVKSYTKAPEFNLSVGPREDALAFKAFAEASGLVLDIGCGPQERAVYLPDDADVVGIDPLPGEQPRKFTFVQSLGEYLPFRERTFDHILYASSLDHMIDARRSLAEAVRCLKVGGQISLWLDGLTSDDAVPSSRWRQWRSLAWKGFRSLSRHGWLSEMGLFRTLTYIGTVAKMKVPEGASDYFHFAHLNLVAVNGWLKDLDLVVTHQQEYPSADSVFIKVAKISTAVTEQVSCMPSEERSYLK